MSHRFVLLSTLVAVSLIILTNICSATNTEVFYAVENSTLLTYTVDPSTLQATSAGPAVNLTGSPGLVQVVPSPNDRFIYLLTASVASAITITVYATDASGAPQEPAIQTLAPTSITQFVVDPNGKFAYAVEQTSNSQTGYEYLVRLFQIDASSGQLTESPDVQFRYGPSDYCYPQFQRFAPDGSRIDYGVYCYYPDLSAKKGLYYRDVDSSTGALGAAALIFSALDSGVTQDVASFGASTLNNFHEFYNYEVVLRIYPISANAKPLITCTSEMLTICGEANDFFQDTTGQYLLISSLNPDFEIVKVDLGKKRLIDTGSSFPALQDPRFSPDDQILYGVYYAFGSNSTIQIYGFDASTGALTAGGQLSFPANLWNVFTAVRN